MINPKVITTFEVITKTFFDLKEDFCLKYMDADFIAFMNLLTLVSEVKDKSTLKVIHSPNSALKNSSSLCIQLTQPVLPRFTADQDLRARDLQ